MTSDPTADPGTRRWLAAADLDRLLDALRADGRTIVGPTVRDDAIILDEILSAADLPAGRGAEAGPGRYRLTRRDDTRRFDHAVGPMSWKRWTFPPRTPIRVGRRTAAGVRFAGVDPDPDPARLHRRPRLRAHRAPDPGPRLPRRTGRRSRLPRPARVGVRRRRRVRDADLDVLLHVDGHRSGSDERLRRVADRARRWVRGPRRFGGRRPRSSTRSTCHSRRSPRSMPPPGSWPERAPPWAPRSTCPGSMTGCRPPRTIRAGPRSPSAAWPARTARSSARPASVPASRRSRTSTGPGRPPNGPGTRASPTASPGWPAARSGRTPRTATDSG